MGQVRLPDCCVIYFGNDWLAENRTSSHHIALRLAEVVPVLYIETPGIRGPQANVRDFRKSWRKLLKAFALPNKIHSKLYVATVPQLPFRRVPLVGLLNQWLGALLVRRALRKLSFVRLISWFVVPHPGHLAKRLGEILTVYYCIDDYAAFPGMDSASIQEHDDHLARQADVVFVAPLVLLESKRALNPNVYFAPHGVDVHLFRQASDRLLQPAPQTTALSRPIIGYFGSVSGRVDFDLMLFLAKSRPRWTFLMIGYASVDVSALRAYKNIVLVGPQPYETLPQWAKAFDVAIVPYRLTQAALHCSPLKLREYLATGKPVVSVTIPEAVRFSDLVYLAEGNDSFLAAIERALSEDTPELSCKRMSAMDCLSWEPRFRETMAVVNELLERL
jgi:glycosyltransferase involved in cell wall biosynthesis